ncbi:iron chelate uptake ABC transporter family permease subunit, partial [Burkholderia sp. SIMBA_024]|uniref:iron chelate uptake ABC transporter family permease subunit n=1 Tax=Burkholderia sp. SIMBA_024 TaxID=3085768 RepID=UPI003979F72B
GALRVDRGGRFESAVVHMQERVDAALGGRTDTIEQAAIVKRIPRTVLALLVGAALALSGATMQAVTRNPVADPGIL